MALIGMGIAMEIVGIVVATIIISTMITSANFTGINGTIAPYISTFVLMGGMTLAGYIGYGAAVGKR